MAEILNLNKARKVKARAADKKTASENRAAHGRTSAEKALQKQRKAEAERKLDQTKLDR